jgi:thiol-disulfide isomerase/thioredoxin
MYRFPVAAGVALISIAVLQALSPAARATGNAAPQIHEALTAVPVAPYDETADAHQAVSSALARARQSGKLVLLDFGGNWCPDCRFTAGVLALGDVKPWIDRNFEVVLIDIGRLNKNMDIGDGYGVHVKAVPTIIILDPTGLDPKGRMLNSGNPTALKDARGMTPQAIADTIYGWIQAPG